MTKTCDLLVRNVQVLAPDYTIRDGQYVAIVEIELSLLGLIARVNTLG